MAVRRNRPVEVGSDDRGVERARRQLALWTGGGGYDREREHFCPRPCFACMVEGHVARMREIVTRAEG